MDVAAWLRGLGLGRYEPTFRENEVYAELLPELTESDLTTMGLPWPASSWRTIGASSARRLRRARARLACPGHAGKAFGHLARIGFD